jgi:predicted permease
MLVSLARRYSARANEIHLDIPVRGFTLAIALGVALVLSFVTSLPSEKELATVSSGGRRASGGRQKQRLQRALVVVQVAVSVVLLAGAGLLTRTLLRLSRVDTGVTTEQVLSMDVNILTGSEMRAAPGSADATRALFTTIRDDIAGLPGVETVSLGSQPLSEAFRRIDLKVDGKPLGPGEAAPNAGERVAGPGYFASLGVPLLRGRDFQSTDFGYDTPNMGGFNVIVNQAFADRVLPGEDPIGRRFAETNRIAQYANSPDIWFTIVGVVGNMRDDGLDSVPRPAFYHPQVAERATGGGLVIRARNNIDALVQPVTQIIRRLAPSAAIENVKTIEQLKDESIGPKRLNAVLIASFGLLAVLIAAVGIAGVLAFAVSLRTNEIGIRMSLGADAVRVQRMILMEGGTLVVAGLAVGIALSFVAANVIRGLLFGVAPHDPATFAGVATLMAAIGIAACWIPAARAARIDPAITMRAEQ